MTDPASESFTITHLPRVSPLSILKLKSILNQASHYNKNSPKLGLNQNRQEVENGKETIRTSISSTKSMGKNRTVSSKQSQTDNGANGVTDN